MIDGFFPREVHTSVSVLLREKKNSEKQTRQMYKLFTLIIVNNANLLIKQIVHGKSKEAKKWKWKETVFIHCVNLKLAFIHMKV